MTMSAGRRLVESALVPVKLPIAAWIGESMRRRGTDVTTASAGRSCVVLAPHPDDETLGCGATVMRKVDAGAAVQVVVISDGATWPPWRPAAENIAVRDAELRASCRILGLPDDAVTHLSFPETKLDGAGDALVDAVADFVRRHAPDEVFVTSEADPHSDHAALARATARALAGSGVRLLAYPIWQWARPRSWARTVAVASPAQTVDSGGYLERKGAAVDVFRSQMSAAAGGEKTGGLRPAFLRHFLADREMFFPVPL
ncbi:MAG TPA: PIG-L deacetylase family protein [Acidimicrobiales bacterium]|nr:PIG-L deacetylase family protein [Acidimicrobiales bacterium]